MEKRFNYYSITLEFRRIVKKHFENKNKYYSRCKYLYNIIIMTDQTFHSSQEVKSKGVVLTGRLVSKYLPPTSRIKPAAVPRKSQGKHGQRHKKGKKTYIPLKMYFK